MDQLISRSSRDMRHFDEDDWTIVGWQSRRVLDDTGTPGKDSNRKDSSSSGTDTFIGFVYVGVLVILMLVFLT